jgi:transposase-like protein
MSNVIVINVLVNCPHCGKRQFISTNAFYGTGTIPQEQHKCLDCNGSFKAMATIDVDVEAI